MSCMKALQVAIPAVLLIGAGAMVLAQAPQATRQNADDTPEKAFRVSTFNIVAPTLVTDKIRQHHRRPAASPVLPLRQQKTTGHPR